MKVVIIDYKTGEVLSTKWTGLDAEVGTVIKSPSGEAWRVVVVEHPVVHLLVEGVVVEEKNG